MAHDLQCGGLHHLERRCGKGFHVKVRGDDKVVRSGLEGEGDVLDDRGAREREVVKQEQWDTEDTYSKDAEICMKFSMQISSCTRKAPTPKPATNNVQPKVEVVNDVPKSAEAPKSIDSCRKRKSNMYWPVLGRQLGPTA
ncbi:hypothetical protein VNO80_01482 [Phaseolus coccineus]|uniref:Uncharacterized protein n=1 Tax=Phaseolus coccineus TaxID=3886 RepID=A0AAN9WWR2_PHACN